MSYHVRRGPAETVRIIHRPDHGGRFLGGNKETAPTTRKGNTMIRWLREREELRRDRHKVLILWACAELPHATSADLRNLTGMHIGALCLTLAELERQQMITSAWGTTENPRRYYTTTDVGNAYANILALRLAIGTRMVASA